MAASENCGWSRHIGASVWFIMVVGWSGKDCEIVRHRGGEIHAQSTLSTAWTLLSIDQVVVQIYVLLVPL